jgi:fucose permease
MKKVFVLVFIMILSILLPVYNGLVPEPAERKDFVNRFCRFLAGTSGSNVYPLCVSVGTATLVQH